MPRGCRERESCRGKYDSADSIPDAHDELGWFWRARLTVWVPAFGREAFKVLKPTNGLH
jgi:hypothetical protein